jgi:CHAD domain-containing protein
MLETLERDWAILRKRVKRSGRHPADDELHRIRVLAKRCRYGAEAIEPVIGEQARDGGRAAAGLQGILGQRHDAIVFRTWLHDTAVDTTDVAMAFAAGEFAGEELIGLQRSRGDWWKRWKRFAKVPSPTRWRS